MSDIKDILGVPRDGLPASKAEKPQKEKLVKPKGMSREAFALLSGSHPLMPSQLVGDITKKSGLSALKEKRKTSHRGIVTFRWQPFDNPGRTDGLQLQHWVKCYKDATGRVAPAESEYNFAKYNKRAKVMRYSPEEWEHLIQPEKGWTREETDYLMDLCSQFDLRWLVIADRYQFPGGAPRAVEDLKDRYYGISRQLLLGREGGPEAAANQTLLRNPYDPRLEKERKKGLELLMARSPQQDAEENVVLEQAQKIEAKRKQEEAARQRQAAPGSGGAAGSGANGAATPAPGGGTPQPGRTPEPVQIGEITRDPPPGMCSLFDARGHALSAAPGQATARGSHQRELAEGVVSKITPPKVQKSVEGSMAELNQGSFPRCATRQTCGAYLNLQQEVIKLLELKRRLQARQAASAGRKGGTKRADSDTETPRAEKRQRTAKKFADD